MRSCEQSFEDARRSAELNPGDAPQQPVVYPNPVPKRGMVSIRNMEQESIVEIYNMFGMLMLKTSDTSFEASMPAGIYLMRISNNDSFITRQLIVR